MVEKCTYPILELSDCFAVLGEHFGSDGILENDFLNPTVNMKLNNPILFVTNSKTPLNSR